jgi:hypothetical protein
VIVAVDPAQVGAVLAAAGAAGVPAVAIGETGGARLVIERGVTRLVDVDLAAAAAARDAFLAPIVGA